MTICSEQTNLQIAAIQAELRGDDQVVGRVLGLPVTRAQLSAAFDRVADKSHWKNPIDATVYVDRTEIEMIREAVVFFTGSVAHFARVGDALPGSAQHICPTCNGGIKQTRGWQWIDPQPWLKGDCTQSAYGSCPAASPHLLGERVGLIWIGEQFYKTPGAFTEESNRLGISRRIQAVPRGFKLGESWVFLAHPKVREQRDPDTGEVTWLGGVFRIFKPQRIEKIVTQSDSENPDAMTKLAEAGITPVIVPDGDRDHQGTVYDDDEANGQGSLLESVS